MLGSLAVSGLMVFAIWLVIWGAEEDFFEEEIVINSILERSNNDKA